MEVLLKDATGNKTPAGGEAGTRDGDTVHEYQPGLQAADSEKSVAPDTGYLASDDGHVPADPMSWNYNNAKPSNDQGMPFSMPDMNFKPRTENVGATNWELLGMGLFEALPPTEMIEELSVYYQLAMKKSGVVFLFMWEGCFKGDHEDADSVPITDIKPTSRDSMDSSRSYNLLDISKLSTQHLT